MAVVGCLAFSLLALVFILFLNCMYVYVYVFMHVHNGAGLGPLAGITVGCRSANVGARNQIQARPAEDQGVLLASAIFPALSLLIFEIGSCCVALVASNSSALCSIPGMTAVHQYTGLPCYAF